MFLFKIGACIMESMMATVLFDTISTINDQSFSGSELNVDLILLIALIDIH